MREILTIIPRILLGLGAGVIISGGVVAFITIIGIIPMMAHRTQTGHHVMWYENAIMVGAMSGSILSMWELRIPLWPWLVGLLLFGFGIFVGALIIALAEVLDVFPIVNRRVKVKKGISLFVLALAAGKLIGSFLYWIYPLFLEVIQ